MSLFDRSAHRFPAAAAAAILLCAVFMMRAECVSASGSKTSSYMLDLPGTFWMGQEEEELWLRDEKGDKAIIDSLTFSKPGVFRVRKDRFLDEDDNVHYDYEIKPAKPGGTTMTVGYTRPDGTAGQIMRELKVKEYPNPIRSLAVNGKKISLKAGIRDGAGGKADQRYVCRVKNKNTAGHVRLSLKKGWKITGVSARLSLGDSNRNYSGKITKKVIIEGRNFSFPGPWDILSIAITLKNLKKETLDYTVCMYRDLFY